jgi:hypothetical protein
MREVLSPIGFIIKNVLLLAIAAYPITLVVQLFSHDIKPFTIYNGMIIHFFGNFWAWMVVALALLFFANKANVLVKTIETLRERLYYLEIMRWRDTPYISPLHLFYLMSPPTSITNDKKRMAYDELYKRVTEDFRGRVFINAKYSSFEPGPTPTIWKVAGKQVWISLITNTIIGALAVAGPFYINPLPHLFDGWAKAFIPVAFFFLLSNFYILRALQIGHPTKTYRDIEHHFGEKNPKVTWRDIFPDTPNGETVLFAWKADCDKRQRLAYELSKITVPDKMDYTSTGLAVRPFETMEIPEWAPIAEQMFIDQQNTYKHQAKEKHRKVAKESNGRVVEFKKRG